MDTAKMEAVQAAFRGWAHAKNDSGKSNQVGATPYGWFLAGWDAGQAALQAEHAAELARLRDAVQQTVLAWEWLGREAEGWTDAHQAVDATLTRLHALILGVAEPPAAPRTGEGDAL